jgi:hypothetical protein
MAVVSFGANRGLKQTFKVLSDSIRKEAGPFVACLSAERDQLSQWRGYGAGGGYAIRFDANALQQYLHDHAPDVTLATEGAYALPIQKRELGKVIYQAAEAIPLIDERLTQSINQFQTFMDNVFVKFQPPSEHPDRELQALLGPGWADLLGLATRLKHDGFEEEQEYRIATFCPPEFFCPSDIGLIPRVNIGFDPSCIQGIMIGPGQHMDTRESSVRAYLEYFEGRYSHVEVCQSTIPFTGV